MPINPKLSAKLQTSPSDSLKDENKQDQQHTRKQNHPARISQLALTSQLRKYEKDQSHNQQSRKNLMNHCSKTSKYLKCKHCPKKFSSSSNRRDHEIRHEQLRRYNCIQCPKKYYRRYLLIGHMQTIHRWTKQEAKTFLPRFKKLETKRTQKYQQQQGGIFQITKCKKRQQILQRKVHFRESDNPCVKAQMESQEFTENRTFNVQEFSYGDPLPLEAIENVGESFDHDDFKIGKMGDRTPLIFGNAFEGISSNEKNMETEELNMDQSFDHFFHQLYAFA